MQGLSALKVAIGLIHMPSGIHSAKKVPLPDGVQQLLSIAVGEEVAIREAVQQTERSPELVKEAAEFFIEQVMLYPGASSYRILGAGRRAKNHELRANMALLIRWLHPDHDRGGARAVFISRVTGAWDNLKTAERRAAYDLTIQKHKKGRKFAAKSTASTRRKQAKPSSRGRRFHTKGKSRQTGRSIAHSNDQHEQKIGFFRYILLKYFNRTLR